MIMLSMRIVILCSLWIATICVHGAKPHIFLVLVDDWGWNDVGYHRQRLPREDGQVDVEINTPNIDNLVRSGIELNRHYTYSFCSPTRASLQSGRLPVHVSTIDIDPISYNPDDPVSGYAGIPRNMTGLAQQLRNAGYKTHMTGKWDAGMATYEHTPMGRGYDTFFGYYHHANDYWDESLGASSTGKLDICYKKGEKIIDLWDTKGPAVSKNGTKWEEYLFTENSLKVIMEHDTTKPDEPLMLFHSFHSIHTPLQVPPEYEKRFAFLKNSHRRKYAAMVEYMDTAIGQMVGALQTKGMWENTIMVLSSDNGGPIYGAPAPNGGIYGGASNLPLRGGKTSDWEGGIRTNAFVNGGALPVKMRGSVLNDYIHVADWYATLCEAAGIKDIKDEVAAKANLSPLDSISQWSLLTGKTDKGPRDEIHVSKMSLIQGNYKVVTGNDGALIKLFASKYMPFDCHANGWGIDSLVCSYKRGRDCSKGCLFDINDDPNEDHQIEDQPDVVASMLARLAELNKNNFEPNRGEPSSLGCEFAMEHYSGFYGPFIDIPSTTVDPSTAKPLQFPERDFESLFIETMERI